jgi:hypothetical protein
LTPGHPANARTYVDTIVFLDTIVLFYLSPNKRGYYVTSAGGEVLPSLASGFDFQVSEDSAFKRTWIVLLLQKVKQIVHF